MPLHGQSTRQVFQPSGRQATPKSISCKWVPLQCTCIYCQMPADLEAPLTVFVSYYNHRRYRNALGNVTPADVLNWRMEQILQRRKEVQPQTIEGRRLYDRTIMEPIVGAPT